MAKQPRLPKGSTGRITEFSRANDSDDFEIRGLGVVFSDPDELSQSRWSDDNTGRDTYGQYFLPPNALFSDDTEDGSDPEDIGTNYYLGDDESAWLFPGRTIPLMYDHGVGAIGPVVVGEATYKGVTDEGLDFLIKVEKAKARKYKQLIEELYKSEMLGLSSQTLATMADIDWMSGAVKAWAIAELSLTPTPAEHRTIESVQALHTLYRKFDIEVGDTDMSDELHTPDPIATDEVPQDDTGLARAADADQVDDGDRDFAAEIEVAIDAGLAQGSGDAQAALTTDITELAGMVTALSDQVAQLTEVVGTLALASDVDQMQTDISQLLEQQIETLGGMFKAFGKGFARALASQVQGLSQDAMLALSNAELDALQGQQGTQPAQPARSGYFIPANAPGQN